MKKIIRKQEILTLLNSEQNILSILKQSCEYFENNKKIAEKINENIWINRSLSELVPETLEKFWSGHIFPLTEAEYELESSIQFCKLGFYKHAIVALRNFLELGLLSVYWDIEDKSHVDIQKWLNSIEPTPFKKIVFERLKTNPNIKKFDNRHRIFDETTILYEQLCNFTHTKGFHFSSRKLGNSNINTFNEKSINKWLEFMTKTIRIVVAFHVLKYPVGLQFTPIDEKFGLGGPAAGFLRPIQRERIRKIFPDDISATLQEISDSDPYAKGMADWVNKQPDITEEEFLAQIEEDDKRMIEMSGFEQWEKNEKNIYKDLRKKNPEEYAKKLEDFKKLKNWARDNNLLFKGRNIKV